MKAFLAFLLLTSVAQAATCKRLIDCVTEASSLTGIKYIYPENTFTTKEELNVEMILDKENADAVLSEALAVFDYMKVPTKVDKVWRIIPGMDIRYYADLPTFKASKKEDPKLPQNQDPIILEYKVQPGTSVDTIARNVRPFMSRYGRVIDFSSGMIMVMDRASTVSKLLSIFREADVPLTKAEKQKLERSRQLEHELARMKGKAELPGRPIGSKSKKAE